MLIKFLNNIRIIKKQDKNNEPYFIIFDNEHDKEDNNAYFCFEQAIRTGWNELKSKWSQITEIEFEYEETDRGKKVVAILSSNTQNFWIDEFVK